jgi:trigger factor
MNQLIMQAAQQYKPEDRQRFAEYINSEPMAAAQLRAPLFEDKVVDQLFATAEISDRKVSRAELEAAIESEEGHVHGPGCGHDHHDHGAKPKKGAAKKPATKKADAPAKEAAAEKPAKKGAAKKAPAKKPAAKKA